MRRIEFIGPPGVGKTTVKCHLIRRLRSAGTKAWDQEALPLVATLPGALPSLMQSMLLSNVRPVHMTIRTVLACLRRPFFDKVLDEFAVDDGWDKFVQHSLAAFATADVNSPASMRRMHLLIKNLTQAMYADLSGRGDIAMFDEGLAQRGVSLGFNTSDVAPVRAYFERMPIPALLVSMDASTETVIGRLVGRDGPRGRYNDLIEVSRLFARECEEIMRARGVPVIIHDAEQSKIDHLVSAVAELEGP